MAIYDVDAINEQELAASREDILDNMLEACDQMLTALDIVDEGARTRYVDRLANRNKKLEIMKSAASSKKTIDRIDDEIAKNNKKAVEVGIAYDDKLYPSDSGNWRYKDAETVSDRIHNSRHTLEKESKAGKNAYKEKYGGPKGEDIMGNKKPGMVLAAQEKKKHIKETCLTILSVLDEI